MKSANLEKPCCFLFKVMARWLRSSTLRYIIICLLIPVTCNTVLAQKGKGGNKDIIPVVTCVKDLTTGLYQASFGYENPTNKEVVVDENGSIIKSNNGKRVAKGLNKFKPGSANKVFTKEFGPGDFVEWTIVSNGNTHTVIANANSSKCPVDDGFIEPVLFNGKSTDIIGQELTSLCDSPVELVPSPLIFQIKEEKVLIEIIPVEGNLADLISLLKGMPFNIPDEDFLLFDAASQDDLTTQLSKYIVVDVYFVKQDLCLLNDYPQVVNFARPVYPSTNNATGVITQGDTAQTSDIVRDIFRTVDSEGGIVPVDGTGVTIGVLSDSYDTAFGGPYAPLDIGNGDLPDDVVLIKDNASAATDEGRAMMQIIHDVAPGATLQFHTATASPRQFEEGLNALAVDSDIIVDDITFITEPFFIGNGSIASAVQSFVDQPGKFHFTSAGNLANKGYQSTFAPSTDVPATNFIPLESPTRAHLFDGIGGSDYLQEISVVPGTYLIALQWKELLASQGDSGALEDLDIYIVDDLGRLLVGSNRVNIAGDPTEIIVFRATGSGTANLLITSANGPTNVPFRYIAFYTADATGNPDGLQFEEYFANGAPTVSGHAMIPNSITTGAVDYRRANAPVAEAFSSFGGPLSDNTVLLVDLYAPDGGNTASTTIGQDAQCPTCDNDGVLNFYGTSAAAPHFAGAMALLMSAAPSWFPPTQAELDADPTLTTNFTADQALELFQTYAVPFTAPDGSAAGFLDTFEAFNNIAAPSAKITELRVEDGITPSTVPFTVKIIGEFFPESTDDFEIRFDDQPLEDVQIVTEEDGSKVITATVPTFSGNPELFVITNSTTPGGTDGGPSNPLTFFEDGKLALNIVANNAEFEYGQGIGPDYYNADPNNPDYVAPFTVEGLPLDENGVPVPFEVLGLPPVVLNNSAIDDTLAEGGFPIVFDYVITPSFGDQTYDQELFQINFIPGFIDPDEGKKGYLTITKKDLTIAPYPIEGDPGNILPEELPPFVYTYGDPIDLTLNYAYDDTGVLNNSFYSVLDASYQSDFKDGLPNKFKAIVSKFKAIVSTENFLNYNLPEDLLNGGSWSASNRTIENKFKAIVSGQNIIDLDTDDFTNFIESRFDFEEGGTSKFKAIVSKFKAIVSSEDLFSGSVDLSIDNESKAIVSKFKAIVSTDDPDRPYKGYESVFSIIDAEDAPPEDGSDDERAISEIFALNLITGLDVTPEGESHFVYPGAYLNNMSANFNITYLPGSLIVLPKDLNVTIDDIVVPYGTVLTKDVITTSFDGWAFEGEFQESVESVFPETEGGIPYYFVKVGDTEETELEIVDLQELGEYLIKIRDPKNYIIKPVNDTFGTVTIEAAPVSFNPEAVSLKYGETPVIDPGFGPFAYEDDEEVLWVDGQIPFYFKKVGGDDTEYTIGGPIKMDVGEYEIFMYDDLTDNYTIIPDVDRGTLIVEPATLVVKTNPLDISYGVAVGDVIQTTIAGFAYDEELSTVYPDGNGGSLIPYLFVKGTNEPLTIEAVKALGTYVIEVEAPSSGNYEIAYDDEHSNLTIGEAPVTFTTLAITISYGQLPTLEPNFEGFAPSEDETVLYVDGELPYFFRKDGATFTLDEIDTMDVGLYEIFITDDPNDNYLFSPDENLGTLTISPATLTFAPSDIIISYGETPVVDPASITGFVFDENVATVFPDGLPYYFVDSSGNQFGPNDILNTGNYEILIIDELSDNYQIVNGSTGTLFVNKATLLVTIEDLLVDEGTAIDPVMVTKAITGYVNNEGEQEVFPGGIQYSIEDVEGNPYLGSEGIYFIKIVEPANFNYTIVYNRIGSVYVNAIDIDRKIRTSTDCVELNPNDPEGLDYIAHFRYNNPNDEVIYILTGPENRLTGTALFSGELPIKFLPGEHTFEIRFDGNTLKWELISLDSNHKTSTTTNVNANSNKCESDDSNVGGAIPTYVLYPNPVNGILHIDQDVSGIVTLEVFDFFGISYLTTQLDGTNAPTTHQIDMSGSTYPDGMYFIRLTSANDVQVFSVIKDD